MFTWAGFHAMYTGHLSIQMPVAMFGFLASFLYKCCWKRLLRLITGKCELVRICERFPLGTARTVEIGTFSVQTKTFLHRNFCVHLERCLKSSKSEVSFSCEPTEFVYSLFFCYLIKSVNSGG